MYRYRIHLFHTLYRDNFFIAVAVHFFCHVSGGFRIQRNFIFILCWMVKNSDKFLTFFLRVPEYPLMTESLKCVLYKIKYVFKIWYIYEWEREREKRLRKTDFEVFMICKRSNLKIWHTYSFCAFVFRKESIHLVRQRRLKFEKFELWSRWMCINISQY